MEVLCTEPSDVWLACVLQCTVPACGPQRHFVVRVAVMCLFSLTGRRGVKSPTGHCVKSGTERKYQHGGLSLTHRSHTYIMVRSL